MYRTVRYLSKWTKLLRPPLGQSAAILPSTTAGTDKARSRNNSSGPDWTHSGDTGPEHWHKLYPVAKGKSQSPIALYSDSPIQTCDLKLHGYRNQAKFTASNVGSTVSFKSECAKMANSPCFINGAHGWWEKYCLNHLHFHWGVTSDEGSEHTIDDKRYPLELHIVHCLGNMSLTQACNRPKGLAVLGFMFEITEEDNPAYTPFIDAMKNVKYKGEEEKVKTNPGLTLESLLPSTLDTGFFYYSGSLTTPPCSEVVQWMVFSDTVPISENQMSVFRDLNRCSGKGCVESMSGNWRPIQPTNDRKVYISTSIDIKNTR